jgi:hypothetical protein
LSPRKLERTIRQMPSQPVKPRTTMTVFSPLPSVAAMATASTMYGMDRNTSVRRMISVSRIPPKNPAIDPSSSPMVREIIVARSPMRRDTRAP